MIDMQSEVILEVKNLSKLFSRSQRVARSRLAKSFIRSLVGKSLPKEANLSPDEFWSLRNIQFTIKRGEALGVIGLNGAGKTTLLRILAGQMLPDQGEVRIVGQALAMIDLTAGFQMNASGMENIYLRGAMLGREKKEIDAVIDEIVDFSELGDALSAPVSTYSSGMLMRLAFSIMMSSNPDILFIDEILSVGDFRFRQKCLSKIRELRQRSAIVLISHSMSDIEKFCDKVICLDHGRVIAEGNPKDVIQIYEEIGSSSPHAKENELISTLGPEFHNKEAINQVEHFWCGSDGNPVSEVVFAQGLYFKISFAISFVPRNLSIGVMLFSKEGTGVTGFSSQGVRFNVKSKPGMVNEIMLELPSISLNPGVYNSIVAILDGPEFLYRGHNPAFSVPKESQEFHGIFTMPHRWHCQTYQQR